MTLCEARAETLKLLLEGKGEPHPFSAMFPPITAEDFDKLVDDIKKNGLLQSIIVYQDKILDGNNRYRACLQANVKPRFTELVESSDASAQRYVISANIHRRHLSPDQRREIIATLLRADPTKSNRQVADTAKASHHTVEDVRAKLEATGQLAQLDKTTGADGKTRKRKAKPKGSGGPKGNKTTITYQEVINAKTALNAYNVLEEHLLDALQDVNEHSDFSQADDLAQRTIEKLQKKLGQMQPEEAAA
jgi:ParB-like chromosome segregation protein Spo0J